METFAISAPQSAAAGGQLKVWAPVRVRGEDFELWFKGPEQALVPSGADAFLIACLPTAMKLGLPLVVEGPVSPRLLAACATVQDIYAAWYPWLTRVPVDAQPRTARRPRAGAAGASFFSGGVDSFYTAYRRGDEIATLVLVHGFDLRLTDDRLRARVSETLRRTAGALGKCLLEVETNSRALTDRYVSWPYQQFGPALGSIAVLLGGVAGRVFIPASESYAHLDPCGSHPLLDPLWGTEEVEILHDGAEASRVQKVAVIAEHPEALCALRVCWENPAGGYNCGRCEKCIRTMLSLAAAGALDKCATFEAPLDPQVIARTSIPFDLVWYHLRDNLRALRERNGDHRLIEALERCIGRYESQRAARLLFDLPPPQWARALGGFARLAAGGAGRRVKRLLGHRG